MMTHHTFDLVLLGAHGVGKSTLGARLSTLLQIPFHDELGRRMRDEALAQDMRQDAAASQPDFDERLWVRERARDLLARARTPPASPGPRRIVETWHIGNAIYAAARAPQEAARWRSRLHSALLSHDVPVVVQPLAVPLDTFRVRFSERCLRDEAVRRFLRRVGWAMRRATLDAPVHTLPTLYTHNLTPDQCAAIIAQRLHTL
jgi:nicotinamide riboside kinase